MLKIHKKLLLLFAGILLVFNFGCTKNQTTDYAFWGKGTDNRSRTEKFWQKTRSRSNLTDAYWRLGGFYQKQGKHRQAIAEFIKAIKTKTEDARIYNSLAVSYDALKEYKFAEMAYQDAIALAPEEAYLYNNYACSSLLRGDKEAAVILFEKAASLNSESRRIKNNLAMASSGEEKRAAKKEVTIAPVVPVGDVADTVKETTPAEKAIAATSTEDDGNWFTHLVDSALAFLGFAGSDKSVDEEVVAVTETVPVQEKVVEESSSGTIILVNALQVSDDLENDHSLMSHKQLAETIKPEPVPHKPVSVQAISAVIPESKQIVTNNRTVFVEVANGNGVKGIAERSAAYFRTQGRYITSFSDARYFDVKKSIIFYRQGYLQDAFKVALMVPGYQEMKQVASLGRPEIGVKVVLGEDMAIMHFPEIMAGFYPRQIPSYDHAVTMLDW